MHTVPLPYAHPVTLQHTALTASVGEPLLYRNELVGAITLGHEGGRIFTAQDQEILRLFAAQAAIAIQNARLFDAVRCELAERLQTEERLQQELGVNAALAELCGPLMSPQTSLESMARLVLAARHLTESAHRPRRDHRPGNGRFCCRHLYRHVAGQCPVADAALRIFPRSATALPGALGHT